MSHISSLTFKYFESRIRALRKAPDVCWSMLLAGRCLRHHGTARSPPAHDPILRRCYMISPSAPATLLLAAFAIFIWLLTPAAGSHYRKPISHTSFHVSRRPAIYAPCSCRARLSQHVSATPYVALISSRNLRN